jgi:rod shape-determining protein MreC
VHDKQVRRRRVVLALLVGVSLILLTAYFGESPSSPLHSVQRGIVEVLSPVQEGASKVLSPFRDVGNYFSNLFNAKSRADKLQNEVNDLRSRLAMAQQQALEDQSLRREVGLDNSSTLAGYSRVGANVIGRDTTLWYQTIQVDRGSDDGVRAGDPVLGDGALVGDVTTVDSTTAIVTLITDHTFEVAAEIPVQGNYVGLLGPHVGDPNRLILSDLPKPPAGVSGPVQGTQVVTAGFKDPNDAELSSLYPPGIPIGTVDSGQENNLLNNGQIDVVPDANLRDLPAVVILTSHQQPGTQRAQLLPQGP